MRVHGPKDLYFAHGRPAGLERRTTVVTNQQRVGRITTRNTPTRTPFSTRPAQSKTPYKVVNHDHHRRNYPNQHHHRGGNRSTSSDEIGRYLPDTYINGSGEKYFRSNQKLGEGGFSVCYLVEDEDSLPMAGKFFTRKASSSRKRLERFEREVNMMKHLNHPNIVKFYDAISGVKGGKTLEDFRRGDHVSYQHPPVMFLEFCSGTSLSSFLKSRANRKRHPDRKYGTLDEEETMWVAYCICRALAYLIEKQILHRDIKLGNLLLQHPIKPGESLVNAGIVLCDFGLATQLKGNELLAFGTAGTPYYIAREVILHEGACYASDMWSLGVTLFYCLTGRAPFNSRSRRGSTSGIYRKIRRCDYRWKSSERDKISRKMRQLVDSMLEEEPVDRPTPNELLRGVFKDMEADK